MNIVMRLCDLSLDIYVLFVYGVFYFVSFFIFFFFKQKTAYEISLGLVGSEMCIRDSI